MIERPFLLDVTRLISRSWTRRRSTGIDRVSYAYLRQFGCRSHAVVQYRGNIRVLTKDQSDILFDMMLGPDGQFRSRIVGFAPRAIAAARRRIDADGAIYINVSHTDFDLDSHVGWVSACRLRPIYLVHDLIPMTHPELCRPHAVVRHTGRVLNALRHASGLILNSEATARELRSFAGGKKLPVPPTVVAPLAGENLAGHAPGREMAKPYFVCVGTIESRKNHALLLKLWERLSVKMGADTPHLVIVGQWGAHSGSIRRELQKSTLLRDHVTVITQCPDEALGRWIANARALLMPTLAEGFGLPMVEALNLGTPVIASDLPCFRETGQGIPDLLDPHDVDAWEGAVLSLVERSPARQRQLALLPHFRPGSWDEHFGAVESWFDVLPTPRRAARARSVSRRSRYPDNETIFQDA